MPARNHIAPRDLKQLIGTPECPALIDVCLDEDFALDPCLVPGAVRCSHTEIDRLRARLVNDRAIIVCQKGKKLSQGVAALLTSLGVQARYLAGGMHAWRSDPMAPCVPASAVPAGRHDATLWVCPDTPGPADMAALWLIRRFIDRNARALFVEADEITGVAKRFGASALRETGQSPYDMWQSRFGLRTAPLAQLSAVLHGLSAGQGDAHPVSAGLGALTAGLARQYPAPAHRLDQMLPVFDALYRWARDGYDAQENNNGGVPTSSRP
ncbi:MAG: chromate resistance protein ChrB domain-containing protein [Pseudomonadota bacterium]